MAWLALCGVVQGGQPPAYPGCVGAGISTTGGRQGTVYRVTNLHPSGPGSLADALSAGDRFVVFTVSGIIDLTEGKPGKEKGGRLAVRHPNITIAGQTAPGEGICLKGGGLQISASNVMVRYLRSRRGFVRDTDTGDAIEIKPVAIGEKQIAAGVSPKEFERIKIKKEKRSKQLSEFAPLDRIVIDHCSASWATDENLTVTHANLSTISWSIAAEGLDYSNSKQTPPNHSEGSLWGSAEPNGRSTMHHMLYAHNRLRNPRTTAGPDQPPVLTLFNSVIYNWSEYATHTGSERVHLNWLGNYYQPGPDTPANVAAIAFGFHGDPEARVYARGNVICGSPEATQDNARAISWDAKLQKLEAVRQSAMISPSPLGELPDEWQTAAAAYAAVLEDAGATLPARDAVDGRIVQSARSGKGRIIAKETDLPPGERWPEYLSLPGPEDADSDGLPDFWERQFNLNLKSAVDGMKISAGGYANLEHYVNNTHPRGGSESIVYVSAAVSRAHQDAPGIFRVWRSGESPVKLEAKFALEGDAEPDRDYAAMKTTVEIPATARYVDLPVVRLAGAKAGSKVVLRLRNENQLVGCPAQALVCFPQAK